MAGRLTKLALASGGVALALFVTWRAASGGDACESFIYEIAPESGGEATAEDAIAAWAEGDHAREYGEVESTGWVLTSEGNGIQLFSHGDSELYVSAIDLAGTTEWFVSQGTICG